MYTGFAAFTCAGLLVTIGLTHDMVGLTLVEVDAYYAGDLPRVVEPPLVSDPLAFDGPTLDLPPEVDEIGLAQPMSRRKLLEVTHFHLFSIPIYWLVLSHLYMLSRARDAAKSTWILVAALGAAAHMIAPWIAALGHGVGPTVLYGLSGLALIASFGLMAMVSIFDMWRRPDPRRSNAAEDSRA